MMNKRLMMLPAVVGLLFVTSQSARAQSVPAKIVGTGAFNSADLSFGGEAVGSHLGKCTFEGQAELFPLDDTGLLLGYIAPDVYTGANGDTIELLGIGTVTLTPVDVNENGEPVFTALWDGTWTVVGGTGRFENASGAYELTAENLPFAFSDPFWFFVYEKRGEIDLGRRGKK